jgi:hypothetical protein
MVEFYVTETTLTLGATNPPVQWVSRISLVVAGILKPYTDYSPSSNVYIFQPTFLIKFF